MVRPSPLVSVIVPVFNRTEYLYEALKSVLGQTYDHFEVLVADDASSMDVESVVRAVADDRVAYFRNEANMGVAGNVAAALERTSGKYFAILNDDDRWESRLLARLVEPLESQPVAVLAFADHYVMTHAGVVSAELTARNSRRWGRSDLIPGLHRPFFLQALVQRAVPIVATLFRRDAIRTADLNPAAGPAYDLWLIYMAARTGYGAYFVPGHLAGFRDHHANQTKVGGTAHALGTQFCYASMFADPALASIRMQLEPLTIEAQTAAGMALLRKGRRREAEIHLKSALRLRVGAKVFLALAASRLVPARLLVAVDAVLRRKTE